MYTGQYCVFEIRSMYWVDERRSAYGMPDMSSEMYRMREIRSTSTLYCLYYCNLIIIIIIIIWFGDTVTVSQLHLFIPNLTTAIHFLSFSESQLPANQPTTTYSQLCCSCLSLLISNLSTSSKSHNSYNTKFSLSYCHCHRCHICHLNSNSLLLFKIFLKFSQLIPKFIHSCHPPTSFQSISAQNYWQIILPPSSCSLEFTAPTSACSFFSITYSNQLFSPHHCLLLNSTNNWKPTFSFNPTLQTIKLLSGLTAWLCLIYTSFTLHSISHSAAHHSSRRYFSFHTWFRQCTKISWQKIISVSFMKHFKSSSFSHITNLTSFRHMFLLITHDQCFLSYWVREIRSRFLGLDMRSTYMMLERDRVTLTGSDFWVHQCSVKILINGYYTGLM